MEQRRGIALILAAAAVCLVVAAIGAYAMHAIFDEDAFADRAASTVHSDEIRDEIGARTAAGVVVQRPDLMRGQAMIEYAATAVASEPAYGTGFRTAAARFHRVLFADPDADASLQVTGSGAALRAQLRQIAGWEKTPRLDGVPLLTLDPSGGEGALRTLARAAKSLAPPLTIVCGIAGLALLALGVARAGSRRRGVWCAGMTVAGAAGLLAVGLTGTCDIVLNQFDTGFGDTVVVQLWDAFLGDLRAWALAAAAAGLVVAAAAGGPRLSLRGLLATPRSRGDRLVRAVGLLALAIPAVTLPHLVLDVGLLALAGGLVYVAAGELVRVLAPPDSPRRVARAVVTAGALLVLLAAVVVPAAASISPS